MTEKTSVKVAQLEEPHLTKLRALENELGVRLVAFEKQHPLANLSDDQLKRVQTTEKELDVVLVAYT